MNGEVDTTDDFFMQRCLDLARLGAGNVAPNPMVGAVLVYNDKIIGEGYHQQYGEAHAEVNCINSVSATERHLISHSTLYVSLEPCSHHGKTPPCADLIIKKSIPKVVIAVRDPFKEVDGKGIEKLISAGVEVVLNIQEKEGKELNKRFFTLHQLQRPYIILKWAQTAGGKIGSGTNERLLISNEITNRLVHKWRSEESAILVGTNTALADDPSLNVRSWKGNDPVRMVIDKDLRLATTLKIFHGNQKTIVFNTIKQEEQGNLLYVKLSAKDNFIHQLLLSCHRLNIQSILVEGGFALLQSFINAGIWDEARIITNTSLAIKSGLAAPILANCLEEKKEFIRTDTITYFANNGNNP
jgi:diaminohydroxyphosphoribosylaminopyrimidine deaminase / 5-amino-6-(5-phosphoribosylamino)uracil reductase